jgi:hypothetical protein
MAVSFALRRTAPAVPLTLVPAVGTCRNISAAARRITRKGPA